MTFQEFLDNVLEDIDEEKGDAQLEGKLKRFINRGYKELAKREGLRKVSFSSIVNGVCRIPSDCNSIYNVKMDNNFIHYRLEGRNITYKNDGDIEIIYSYTPEDLEDMDDTPLTNSAYNEFIISYAKYLYYMMDLQVDIAKLHKIDTEAYKIVRKCNNVRVINVYGGF